jgi:FMN phosphatase YigB (HAD superfamily)
MNPDIEAIFLDVGNTLRIVIENPVVGAASRDELMRLVGASGDVGEFFKMLEGRWDKYREWSFANLLEASETELWTKWLLPDYPADKIAAMHGRLTRLWRDRDGQRVPRPDAKSTILELHRRGYKIGIIANTITETEIPEWLEEDGLTKYIDAMVLSSIFKHRKPGTEIYHEAARRIGVEPARCMYVGDNPSRDVPGTRKAGFGMIIVLMDPEKLKKEPPTGEGVPDRIIHNCSDLLDIFPPRNH